MSRTERWSMPASSLTSRLKRWVMVRDWPWWQLPPLLRWYVATPIAAWVAVASSWPCAPTGVRPTSCCSGSWSACGSISSASTPRVAYTSGGGVTRDFSSIWVLPTAILLPPIYALVVPIPFIAVMQLLVHRGVVYRRVFTAAATGLSYAAASWVFHSIPASFAGASVGPAPTPSPGAWRSPPARFSATGRTTS